MTSTILRATIEIGAGVMPGAIEDLDIRIREMFRKPLGAYQRFWICKSHMHLISL